jgi:predicted dehydrogenase
MRALIVGTGFGNLYKSIYESLGWNITTVDIADPSATYDNIDKVGYGVDIAHICTPNFTHYELANKVARFSKIVMVEKPGVATSEQWQKLLENNPNTRFMMTKNNQYRSNIQEMIDAAQSGNVYINWVNKNRIPNAGNWFTNKDLAFGGVSRDLLPHLLSLYQLFNPFWRTTNQSESEKRQRWTLNDIESSDYGTVNKSGVYNVDDFCYVSYDRFKITANWRSNTLDNIGIKTENADFGLGLCPEEAYKCMIETAHANTLNDDFWDKQKEMDLWIHRQLETL